MLRILLLCLTLLPSLTAANEAPDIIFIVADDMGWGDAGCYGGDRIPTPNIDRLAAEGVRCTDFYVPQPLCAPARAATLTGREPRRNGVHNKTIVGRTRMKVLLPPSEILLPQELAAGGYRSIAVGKWNLGFAPEVRPLQRGFDHFFGHPSGGLYFTEGQMKPAYSYYDGNEPQQHDGYSAELYTDGLIRHARPIDKPIFVWAAYGNPHSPAGPNTRKDWAQQRHLDRFPQLEGRRRQYAASVSSLDDEVGRILALQQERGRLEESLIVFFSDNGGAGVADNGPFSGGKKSLREGGIRVPCIIRWPGRLAAGSSCTALLSSMDLFALALGAADLPLPEDRIIDGRDPLPALMGTASGPHAELCFDWRGGEWAIRSGPWKATHYGLFQLAEDPAEAHDLRDQDPERYAALQQRHRQWLLALEDDPEQ